MDKKFDGRNKINAVEKCKRVKGKENRAFL